MNPITASNEFSIENFFPLYTLLQSQVETPENHNKLTDEEIKSLLEKINLLDKKGRDLIYVFIRVHCLRNTDTKILDIPYNGIKMSGKQLENDLVYDVKFDLRNFPPILCRMLNRFTDLHLRKLQEEKDKQKIN